MRQDFVVPVRYTEDELFGVPRGAVVLEVGVGYDEVAVVEVVAEEFVAGQIEGQRGERGNGKAAGS
jgi:hypothetical protein